MLRQLTHGKDSANKDDIASVKLHCGDYLSDGHVFRKPLPPVSRDA